MSTLGNAASYIVGQCTYYVASALSWVPAGWGNAYQWWQNAISQGYQTSQTPVVGSIAVWSSSLPGSEGYGHVAEVTGVNSNGSFNVSEMNYSGGPGVVDTRTVTNAQDLLGFILPPTGTSGTATTSSSSSSSSGISSAISGAESALQSFVQRAAWVLLAAGLVVTGVFLLVLDEGGREVEQHPEVVEALA